jgi:hypothetical protein
MFSVVYIPKPLYRTISLYMFVSLLQQHTSQFNVFRCASLTERSTCFVTLDLCLKEINNGDRNTFPTSEMSERMRLFH